MQQGHVILDYVEITILDEADHMADLGFLPGVRRIMDKTPARAADALLGHARRRDQRPRQALPHQSQDARADSAQSPVSTMAHHVLHVDNGSHLPCCSTSAAPGRTVVFTRTKHQAKKVSPSSSTHREFRPSSCTATSTRVPARATWTTSTQAARRRSSRPTSPPAASASTTSRSSSADPPVEHKAYLHRSGRTRAGSDGTVVTMMLDEQVRDVRDLTRKAGNHRGSDRTTCY